LIGIETVNRAQRRRGRRFGGIPLVTGSAYSKLAIGLNDSGELGVTIKGGNCYTTDVNGGELGGLMSFQNNNISNDTWHLDLHASTMIQK
jgi:hypothetical protein